ncbi:hypothetical protein IG3_05455 [Bacillus cereus HuA2-1]|uniref:Uncharacterized protein n=1 Tax=Bacillus cereus HuA2-1 TaxID=1053201 RepID=J9BPN9_BACCE|nr:hypothetical protein IG3_05455 [Bacillus cereus HuA2-1]
MLLSIFYKLNVPKIEGLNSEFSYYTALKYVVKTFAKTN